MKRVLEIAWRIIKVLPFVGVFVVLASAGEVMRRKGYALGVVSVALDILPVICVIKALVEVFTGDLIPDKAKAPPAPEFETAA